MCKQKVRIREYDNIDWESICHIHDKARLGELEGNVPLDAFNSLVDAAENEGLFDGQIWVAEIEKVLGFIAFEKSEITWLYVSPKFQKKGIGRQLLRFALSEIESPVDVTVLSNNGAAIRLYEKEGFVICKTKKGKLAGNEKFIAEGHIMVKY
jgi:ribosomal protein S18 acetylase RimI-like enzyme